MEKKKNILKIPQIILIFLLITFFDNQLYSQGITASPANWIYPEGNASSTKYVGFKSKSQILDSMVVKWTSSYISGDVQPLIGNIVDNGQIINDNTAFPYSQNEIAAVIGDNLVILNGAGKLLTNYALIDENNNNNGLGILGISALLDTNSTYSSPSNTSRTLILGFESIEAKRKDSLAVAYIGGWNRTANKFNLLKRLALNLREDFLPNVSASIKPIFSKKRLPDDGYEVFVSINMAQPIVSSASNDRPYFHGLTKFNLKNTSYPLPDADAADDYYSRMYIGPQVSFASPSISAMDYMGTNSILLPCLPISTSTNDIVENTYPNYPYLLNYEFSEDGINEKLVMEIDEGIGTNPRIRPYYVELNDTELGEGEKEYILMTTEYNGIQGSNGSRGRAGLFLYDSDGMPLFDMDTTFGKDDYPFFGEMNHYWSVAMGNVDGNSNNQWLPYYPNNHGKEIIVTQSSRSFAYAGSKLMVLRYYSGYPVPKASPPDEYLRKFDTICTQVVSGWVAAVNDIDGIDGKDEILLVGGTDLKILRMNDYASVKFRSGRHFDTVFSYTFENQTITSAAIADVDGDGLNDIVVTTNEGLFVLGTPLSRTIDITNFAPNTTTNFCFADTVTVKWNNIIQGNNFVNIYLQKYKNGNPIQDSLIVLEKNYPNSQDSMSYSFIVDLELMGSQGRVIVESVANPKKNTDTTGNLVFGKPNIIIDSGKIDTIYSGAQVSITGDAFCADSIALFYSFTDDSTAQWIQIGSTTVDIATHKFTLVTNMPCVDFFECSGIKADTVIFGRLIYKKNSLIDSGSVFPITIKPAKLSITIDTCKSICPSRIIRWNYTDSSLTEINLNILISEDMGNTFKFIETVPFSAGIYEWHVPSNISDGVILRLCSEDVCLRTDTLIENYTAKYIKTVAPNPLKIPYEAEIVYSVEEDSDVTMRILDQANKLVKELVRDSARLGGYVYCEKWDGRLTDGTPVANGMYYILLEFSNGAKEVYPIFIRN